jgi:OOP family OmpA-OmpF porin
MKRLALVPLLTALGWPGAALAGGFVGGAVLDASIDGEIDKAGVDLDADDTGFKIYGGYTFARFFRLEGSYVDFGSPEAESGGVDVSIDPTAWTAFAAVVIPLGKFFEIFGKAGLATWETDVVLSAASDFDEDGTDPAYGAGIAFKLPGLVAVRAEYERFDFEGFEPLDTVSAGLDFRF